MPEADFPVEMVGGVPVVAAPDEIDITSADGLRAAMLDAAARGRGTFVVDMSRTRFCDSSGLHALVAAYRRAQAEDGEVLLVIPDAAVLRVFAITGMDQVIPNFASLDEALAHTPDARAGVVQASRAEPDPPEGSRRDADRGRAGQSQQSAVTGTRAGRSLASAGDERVRDDAAISPVPPP